MKRNWVLYCALCLSGTIFAQTGAQEDPVVMKINGKPVTRSEFEYNFNKNNGENVVDRKSVAEYVDLFVNYKLKVEAALDERFDTLSSFRREFKGYRDLQIRPYFVTDGAEEAEVRRYYDQMKAGIGPDGLVAPAHIMVMLPQTATPAAQAAGKARIDSIYNVLRNGGDFEELARRHSDDKNSAVRGGAIGWVAHGQTVKEFEDAAFALQKGEMSEPVLSPLGYHIILMQDRKQLEPYEELKSQIHDFLEQRGLKDRVAALAIDSVARASGGNLTADDVIEQKTKELCAADLNLKYLVQEYHDGLLLYEISNREVWDKAAKDEDGLKAYFAAHRSKYKWDAPRYKGVVYHSRDKDLAAGVRKLLKSVDEKAWVDTLRACYNRDSVQQIRVEKSLFKQGDNAFVDHLVFKVKTAPAPLKQFPYTAVYGKKLKKPEVWTDVRGEVIADYQTACEEDFVRRLREKYKVEVYQDVLNTVNQH